jgi:hypothetical protein
VGLLAKEAGLTELKAALGVAAFLPGLMRLLSADGQRPTQIPAWLTARLGLEGAAAPAAAPRAANRERERPAARYTSSQGEREHG